MKAIVKDTALNAAAAILDRGSLVVLTALLSSALTPAAFSGFGQFQLTLTMLAAYSGVGVSVSAARIFAEHRAGRPSSLPLIGTMWALSLVVAVVLGLGAVSLGALDTIAKTAATTPIPGAILILGVVLLAGGIVPNGGILGLALFRESVWIAAVAALAAIGVGVAAARSQSAVTGAWALVIGYGATTILASAIVLRATEWRKIFAPPTLSAARVSGIASLIGPLAGVTLLAATGNWLTGYILLHYAPSELAFPGFVIGLQWYALAQFLPGMLTRAVFPSMVQEGSGQGARRMLLGAIRAGVGMSLATGLAVATVASFVAPYFYRGVIDSGLLLVAFAFAALPQSVAALLGNAIIVRGRQAAWFGLTLLWFLTLIASALLLARWGALGAAASLFIAGVALTASSWLYVRWRIPV